MLSSERTKRSAGIALASVLAIGALVFAAMTTVNNNRAATAAAAQAALSKGAMHTQQIVYNQPGGTLQYTNTTFVNLDKDCATFTDIMFIQNVISYMGWDGVYNTIAVAAIACGGGPSISVFYQCGSNSVANALQNCVYLKLALQNKVSPLSLAIRVTLPDVFNMDGTCNNAIYALYTLILLPVFCCAGFLLWYRMKQSQADSQYLQDTATFSNVAARQTHTPYDPAAVPPPVYYPAPQYVAPQYVDPMQYAAPQYAAPMPQYVQPVPQYAAPPPMGYAYPQ